MFFVTFLCCFLQVASLINRCLFWRQLTTEFIECILIKNLLQIEIVTPVTTVLMQRTAKYLITFTPKCFALAVAAVSADLRGILLNKICKIVQFLCPFVNWAHARWPILHIKIKLYRKSSAKQTLLRSHAGLF